MSSTGQSSASYGLMCSRWIFRAGEVYKAGPKIRLQVLPFKRLPC